MAARALGSAPPTALKAGIALARMRRIRACLKFILCRNCYQLVTDSDSTVIVICLAIFGERVSSPSEVAIKKEEIGLGTDNKAPLAHSLAGLAAESSLIGGDKLYPSTSSTQERIPFENTIGLVKACRH